MGIIDSTYHRIECENCGIVQTHVAHQKGSSFSPGRWSVYESPDKFKLSVVDDEVNGPRVDSAACKSCGTTANIELATFSRPNGW